MPKTKISEFSATPANNTDIDSINISEGCAPSGINDAIRELMAQLKDFQTGAVGDSFNGPIGAATASTGAFTTLSATGAITSTLATGSAPLVIASTTKVANLNVDLLDGADWAAPAALGSTTPAAVSATTLTTSSTVTLNGGTANGVAYLNGSKVVTSGSALTFDGTTLTNSGGTNTINKASGLSTLNFATAGTTNANFVWDNNNGFAYLGTTAVAPLGFNIAGSEQMRLTSTGLGIGTSSPSVKLSVVTGASTFAATFQGSSSTNFVAIGTTGFGASINGYTSGFASAADLILQPNGGNLGLGVTPSAWGAGSQAFQNGGGSVFQYNNDRIFIGQNNYINASFADIYTTSNYATRYRQYAGTHAWFNAPSGTAGNAITFTQAMTLDASGRLGIGTTSPISGSGLTIGDDSSGSATVKLAFSTSAAERGSFSMNGSTGEMRLTSGYSGYGGFMTFYANGSERARIDSSGNLLVGTTSVIQGGKYSSSFDGSISNGIVLQTTLASAGTGFIRFVNSAGTSQGEINATTTSVVAYLTTSDYRLKNTIAPMTGALAKVAQLKPVTYKWNADGSDGQGFIAHELAEVCPDAVSGEKDAVDEDGNPKYQGIDTSFLVATLTAALQEQQAIIESLKARLDAANL